MIWSNLMPFILFGVARDMFSRIPNPQFFFLEFFLSSLQTRYNVVKTVYFHTKKHFAAPLTFFVKKKLWIRRFGIRENMSRASNKASTELSDLSNFAIKDCFL